MTVSALCFSLKIISAITVGVDEIILQLCISPPLGIMADSISAAVVPGAKLVPTTTYGPAVPRMLSSSPGLFAVVPLRCDWVTAASKSRSFLFCRTSWVSRGGRAVRTALDCCVSWFDVLRMSGFGLGVPELERWYAYRKGQWPAHCIADKCNCLCYASPAGQATSGAGSPIAIT